ATRRRSLTTSAPRLRPTLRLRAAVSERRADARRRDSVIAEDARGNGVPLLCQADQNILGRHTVAPFVRRPAHRLECQLETWAHAECRGASTPSLPAARTFERSLAEGRLGACSHRIEVD